MLNRRVITVIKRELKDKLFSKTFIIMTISIPVLMIGMMALQTLFMTMEGDSGTKLRVASENPVVLDSLKAELAEASFIKEDNYDLQYEAVSEGDAETYIDRYKNDMLDGNLTGVVYIPDSAVTDKQVKYYSKNPNNNTMFQKMRSPINNALLSIYFADKSISQEDISYARRGVGFTGYRVKKDAGYTEEGYGNKILSFLFTFLLYFSLIILGSMVMRAVVEEKNNRIVEVLLSSVKSKELMTGKILGNSITGVIQMFVWLIPVILLVSTSWFMIPEEFMVTINIGQLVYILFNYFLGLLTFMGLFASVGAIFDNDQDAQSGMWPVMMLIIIPFFISFSMANNPDNTVAVISSMAPFASIIVMPARMALVDVPTWQVILTIVVNLLTLAAIFPVAGKIYQVGILKTGKKPKWSEVIKWLKVKY